jgi:uncharacterized membrane protein
MSSQRDRAKQRPQPGPSALAGVVLGLLGFILGAGIDESAWGAFSGAMLGVLLNAWRGAKLRAAALTQSLTRLEIRLRALETAPRAAPEAPSSEAARAPEVAPEPATAPVSEVRPAAASTTEPTPASPPPVGETPLPPRLPRPTPSPEPRQPLEPTPFERGMAALRDLAFGGNTVVRVGVLVLLVGVLLLAKWAADNALFPVEARLACASAIGLGLVVIGYRLRDVRAGFATTLQGGGVAALYLVIFMAFRLFELVPAGLAFSLFVVISASGGLLAVLQRSQPLIFIGSLGGFLAPVLASTGGGNHVVLFGYYLLLISAIAAVAWRQSWRALNLLAFFCTYGVATVWGVLRYRADDFATTEPFLLAYMVLFTGIAVLYGWRQPPKLRGLVDGTLVFGTPLITLLAQARLVHEMEMGLALSAAGFGLFYALLAGWLWRAAPTTMRPMAEAFVALAVGFATMAIPFALDDAMTTAIAWSLEGAGLYWVGIRQNRRLPRYTAIGLQVLAMAAFVAAESGFGARVRAGEVWAVANAHFISCLSLAWTGLFIAQQSHSARETIGERESNLSQWLIGWGLFWWATGSIAEIDHFVKRPFEPTVMVFWLAATAIALERAAATLDWRPGRIASLVAIPAAFFAIPITLDEQGDLIRHGAALAWVTLVAAVYYVLARLEQGEETWAERAQAPALWLAAVVASVGAVGLAERTFDLSGDWPGAAFGLAIGGSMLVALKLVKQEIGGFGRYESVQLGAGLAPVAVLASLWFFVANFELSGQADPLPYLPLLNPADLAFIVVALGVLAWLRQAMVDPEVPFLQERARAIVPVLVGLAFIWLNGLLARSVHQWTDARFDIDSLWDSAAMQVTWSIAWTLVALAGMWLATQNRWRPVWMTAATLLGVVVAKLFLVDLSQLGTGAKIVTFLVVGALLLVVGWLSPVPPSEDDDEEEEEAVAVPAGPPAEETGR